MMKAMICSIMCDCSEHDLGAHCFPDSGSGGVHLGVRLIGIPSVALLLASSDLEC